MNSDADDRSSVSRFEVKPSFVHAEGASSANQKGASEKDEDENWRKVRVLCFVVTHPKALETQTTYIKKSWGPRCDQILYVSDENNSTFPTVKVTDLEGPQWVWAKTKNAFHLIYQKHLVKFDWVIKVEDDTFVHVRNLKRFLLKMDQTSITEYYGQKFAPYVKGGYPSPGGYVMSKEVLKRLVTIAYKNETGCPSDKNSMNSDMAIGLCMQSIGVELVTATSSMTSRGSIASSNVASSDITSQEDDHELFHAMSPEAQFNLGWKRVFWFDRHAKSSSILSEPESLDSSKASSDGKIEENKDKLMNDDKSDLLGIEAANKCCPKRDVITFHSLKGPVILWVDFMYNNFTTRH